MRFVGNGRYRSRSLIALVWISLAAAAAAAQFPAPRLQVPPANPFANLDLVLSYVTVTAPRGQTVPRLRASDFQILEDNKEQKIEHFSVEDQPVTVGILWGGGTGFDDPAPDPDIRECPRTFVKSMPAGSEYFVLAGDTVITSYSTNPDAIPRNFATSGSSTDSMFIGLDVLKESAYTRRILLVITNPAGGGGGQLQQMYLERVGIRGGSQIHVASFMSGASLDMNHQGGIFFAEMTDLTGGSYYQGPPSAGICADLARELRVQYLIGYKPSNALKDGKWRRLGVKLLESAESGLRLKARIRRGYYAPKE